MLQQPSVTDPFGNKQEAMTVEESKTIENKAGAEVKPDALPQVLLTRRLFDNDYY